MEILPGIHLADKGYSNTYLLVREGKLILIDTGMDKNAKKILEYIQGLGYRPSDISHILLTHSHLDHVNGLAKIKELSNAKVAIHTTEAAIVSGEESMILPKGPVGTVYKILSPFMGYKPVMPDILLNDKGNIEGLEVIHVPGHTPGCVCYYFPEKRVLFSGDLIFYEKNNFTYPESKFNLDEDMMKSSIKKF